MIIGTYNPMTGDHVTINVPVTEEDILQWQMGTPASVVFNQKRFVELQKLTRDEIHVDESIVRYIVELVRATRAHEHAAVGSSPRGGVALLDSGRAMALIHGRDFVVPDDIKEVAIDALSHRVILHTEVILDGVQEQSVVDAALEEVPVPVGVGDGTYGAVADSKDVIEAIEEVSSDLEADAEGEEIDEES